MVPPHNFSALLPVLREGAPPIPISMAAKVIGDVHSNRPLFPNILAQTFSSRTQNSTMSVLSDADIIAKNPIGNGLDAFRHLFGAKCKDIGVSGVKELAETSGARDLALELILALQSIPLSRALPSRIGRGTLLRDLSILVSQIDSGEFNIRSIIPLFEQVHSHASNLEICNALFVLIGRPATPSQSSQPFTASFQQTPWTFNTGSFADTSDLGRDVDPILKGEVEDNLIIDHPGFFDTFFGQIPQLLDMAAAVFQMCEDGEPPLYRESIGWVEWPEDCEESRVLRWLRRHIDQFLQLANERGFRPLKRRRCVTTPNKAIPGSVSKRKLDVGFAYGSSENNDILPYDWSHILVPGELKSNPREDNYSSTWLDLLRYAREVFSGQDIRRFVHGFTICGPNMRLWVFDRLGGVASRSFDVNKEGQMFVSAILGFLWMNEEELGFDPTIVEADGKRYTEIRRNSQVERLYLEELMKRQRSIAGRATTCWKACLMEGKSENRLAIKDSWEFEERPEEGLLLKEATEAGVENVARYYHHETVRVGGAIDDVRNNVRKGLNDASGRNPFQQRRPTMSEAIASPDTSGSSGLGTGRGRSRSITRKRSSSCIQTSMPPPKRSCSDSPVKQDAQRQRNRVHRRVIMRDVGKSIYHASSPQAILTGLLGGIKGHESLLNAKILHRDISAGNVMLDEAENDGFLIDLDLAVKIDREKVSGAPSKTGTKVFMAIGALYEEEHSFMHDLESFFWVLFWICVHWNGPGKGRSKTEYESWNYKDTKELAEIKKGKVDEEDKFDKEVKDSFTPYCKPLIPCIQELRKVVFPDGKRWLDQDQRLYSQMKLVLEEAREDLRI